MKGLDEYEPEEYVEPTKDDFIAAIKEFEKKWYDKPPKRQTHLFLWDLEALWLRVKKDKEKFKKALLYYDEVIMSGACSDFIDKKLGKGWDGEVYPSGDNKKRLANQAFLKKNFGKR